MPCVIFCHLKNRMNMKNEELYREMAQEVRRELAQEQERLADKARRLEERMQLMDAMEGLLEENRRQREEMESLQQQLAEKKNEYEVLAGTAKNLLDAATEARNQKKELEMQLAETRKLSEGVAKKSSEEGVIKALQIFVNRSKNKKADKRAYIKTTILEFANTIKLSLPDELANSIDNLDDELSEPKIQIKEYVAQKLVDTEVQNVEVGATGVVKRNS